MKFVALLGDGEFDIPLHFKLIEAKNINEAIEYLGNDQIILSWLVKYSKFIKEVKKLKKQYEKSFGE